MFAREGCTGITINHLPEEHKDATDAKASVEEAGARVNVQPCLRWSRNASTHRYSHGEVWKAEHLGEQRIEAMYRLRLVPGKMFAVTKFALPHLKRGSNIINTTSVTAAIFVDYSSKVR